MNQPRKVITFDIDDNGLLGAFRSTQEVVTRVLERQRARAISPHLEIETYTWDVLPEVYRRDNVVDAITREIDWVRAKLGA